MPDLVRFGPFELDLDAAELTTNGRKLRLPGQQFQILHMLVVQQGRVVSREDIRKRLWPNDTVVEFDRSINAAIMKLRLALGDTGDKPRYIETLVKRGYRLLVPVEQACPPLPAPGNGVHKAGSLIGQRVSHYRVLGVLGGGGMGLVYKGEDLKLDRPVALKFLPEELAADPVTLQRFEREARTASSLNHPNICTIYEVEEHDGHPFIVMELLEGETLRELVARFAGTPSQGRYGLPLPQLLDIGIQIAEGLNAAHQKGIIHRDIKPANIFVMPSGKVKILDFGLAKSVAKAPIDPPAEIGTQSSELRMPHEAIFGLTLSRTGSPIGTAGYMSPEQLRGENLDARTDLFSFGLILYEMVSGQRPFEGSSVSELSSAILNAAPRPLPEGIPYDVSKVILRSLKKSREERFQQVSEIQTGLQACKASLSIPGSVENPTEAGQQESVRAGPQPAANGLPLVLRRPLEKRAWFWSIAAAISLLLGAAVLPSSLRERVPRVTSSKQLTDGSFPTSNLATDGDRLYFFEDRDGGSYLAQMSVSGGDISLSPVAISHPIISYVSHERSELLVGSPSSAGSPFWIVPLPKGAPQRVVDIDADSATWKPDGKVELFTRDSDIYLSTADGSAPRKIVSMTQGTATCARFTPDGSRIRFNATSQPANRTTLWEVRSDGSDLHQLLIDWPGELDLGFTWTPDGRYFLFASDDRKGAHDIFAMRESRGLFRGSPDKPVRLTLGPLRFDSPMVSSDGKRLFALGWHQRGELVRYDSASRQFLPFLGGLSAAAVAFSPDGTSIAYTSLPSFDLWRSRLDGSEKMHLTSSPGGTVSLAPRWSPDGNTIAYTSVTPGKPKQIILVDADGGKPRPLPPENTPQSDGTWSADGSELAFSTGEWGNFAQGDIEIYNLHTGQLSKIPGSSGKFSPRWSPDGLHLAATSFERNPRNLFLYDFKAHRWELWATDDCIGYPSWSADGRSIQYEKDLRADRDPEVRSVRIGDVRGYDRFSLKGLRRFDAQMGPWSDATPDGSRMFVRDVSGRDIYAFDVEFP